MAAPAYAERRLRAGSSPSPCPKTDLCGKVAIEDRIREHAAKRKFNF